MKCFTLLFALGAAFGSVAVQALEPEFQMQAPREYGEMIRTNAINAAARIKQRFNEGATWAAQRAQEGDAARMERQQRVENASLWAAEKAGEAGSWALSKADEGAKAGAEWAGKSTRKAAGNVGRALMRYEKLPQKPRTSRSPQELEELSAAYEGRQMTPSINYKEQDLSAYKQLPIQKTRASRSAQEVEALSTAYEGRQMTPRINYKKQDMDTYAKLAAEEEERRAHVYEQQNSSAVLNALPKRSWRDYVQDRSGLSTDISNAQRRASELARRSIEGFQDYVYNPIKGTARTIQERYQGYTAQPAQPNTSSRTWGQYLKSYVPGKSN